MKVQVHEHKYGFGINFTAETLEDAAWITRFQLNVKREVPFYGASVTPDHGFSQWMSFNKKVENKNQIERGG